MQNARATARAMGWASIAIGLAAVLAPGASGLLAGYRGRRWLPRVFGARDLIIGTALLVAADARPWLRARYAAEVADTVLHTSAGLVGLFGRKRALLAALASAGAGAIERRAL